MPIYLKTSTATNSWRKATSLYLKTSTATNSWRKIVSAYIKTNDGWRSLFSSIVFPSIETRVEISSSGGINAGSTIMNDSNPITLTSTRYHWNDADGFTYVWQKSSNNVTWTNIGTEQTTTNPASGSSSSSITKTLSASDFTSGSDMYFRFVSYATNSASGTSGSSESLSILISYYGTPVPISPYPNITGSTTVGYTAYGNIGNWTNSPTQYDYQWSYLNGLAVYPLTDTQSRTISTKTLSGYSASITTSAAHGYRSGDSFLISGIDNLFNGSQTITSVSSNSISFTLPTPISYSLTNAYAANTSFVDYFGNAYKALQSMPTPTTYVSTNSYSSGSFVQNGSARYVAIQAVPANTSITNTAYWQNIAPTNTSYWQLQSFSGTVTSGSTLGYIYFDGTVYSSTSIALTTLQTDAKTLTDLRGKVLYFIVKAYNAATLSPSGYAGSAFIYGYPVITVGTIVPGPTSASIPYTQSYMTEYDIDVKYLGASITGYPKTVTSPSSPISVIGLTAPRTYTYTISPKNAEGTYGLDATGSFTTVAPPTISGVSLIDSTQLPGSAVGISTNSTSNIGTTSWTNGSNTSFANLYSVTGAGTGGAGVDPTSLATSGTFTITSSGNASITIRAINQIKQASVTWAQTNAQSYTIEYSIGGLGAQIINANSSASNPSVLLYSGTTSRSITLSSITVWSEQNQNGTPTTVFSTASITPTNKTTNTSATNSVTYLSPPGTPTISYSSVTSSSFTVSWSASGATSYNVQIYESVSGNNVSGYPLNGTTNTSATVSGLSPNRGYTTTITAINTAGSSSNSASTTTLKLAALTPTFGANTSISGGFTGSVTNYDANYTWGISVNSGSVAWGTIVGNVRTFTVSGLSAGGSATVTVTTTRTNYFDGSAQTTGTASSNIPPSGGSISISLSSGTSGRVGAVYIASVTNASGSPTPTYTLQWRRSLNYSPFTTSNIGTGASTYTTTFADVDSSITCIATFTNAAGSQTATSNALLLSPPTITGIGATTTNNTAPYVTWTAVGYNFQSTSGSVYYGSTTPPTILSGTAEQVNAGVTRSTSSRSGTTANYYRYNTIRAYSGTSGTGARSGAITTTTIVRANAATTITVYGTYP